MKKAWLSTITATSIALLIASGWAQNYAQELVGTVSCPACVVKGARRIDLGCARACFAPKKTTDAAKSSNADATKNPNPDFTDTANTNPIKNTNTNTDLVIITDDYRTIGVDNPDKLKSHLAHRIAATGYWTKGGFHVISVRTL